MDKSNYEAQITDIISLSVDKIYQSQEVVEKEIAGYKIISDILDERNELLLYIIIMEIKIRYQF